MLNGDLPLGYWSNFSQTNIFHNWKGWKLEYKKNCQIFTSGKIIESYCRPTRNKWDTETMS